MRNLSLLRRGSAIPPAFRVGQNHLDGQSIETRKASTRGRSYLDSEFDRDQSQWLARIQLDGSKQSRQGKSAVGLPAAGQNRHVGRAIPMASDRDSQRMTPWDRHRLEVDR